MDCRLAQTRGFAQHLLSRVAYVVDATPDKPRPHRSRTAKSEKRRCIAEKRAVSRLRSRRDLPLATREDTQGIKNVMQMDQDARRQSRQDLEKQCVDVAAGFRDVGGVNK